MEKVVTSKTFEEMLNEKIAEINKRIADGMRELAHSQNNEHERAVELAKFGYSDADDEALKKIEKDFALQKQSEMFAECNTKADVLIKLGFWGLAHKVVRNKDTKVVESVEQSTKFVYLDLKKYCTDRVIEKDWYNKAIILSKLYAIQIGKDLGVSAAEVAEIDKTYVANRIAQDIADGKTPASNRAVVKATQEIFDMLTDELEPDVREKLDKIGNADRNFYIYAFTKGSKAPLKVALATPQKTIEILMQMFHTKLTENGYGLEYKKIEQ